MKTINSQSKASYRSIVSFVAMKGIKIVERNRTISEWVRNKAVNSIENLLYEGEWVDEDDFDVEMTVLSTLRSSALSALKNIVPEDKCALNGLINFLKI
jgi:hypothetical protein